MSFKKNLPFALIIGVAATIIIWVFYHYIASGFFGRYEAFFSDMKMRNAVKLRAPESSSFQQIDDVVIIDIDSRSFSKLGKFYGWPEPIGLSL